MPRMINCDGLSLHGINFMCTLISWMPDVEAVLAFLLPIISYSSNRTNVAKTSFPSPKQTGQSAFGFFRRLHGLQSLLVRSGSMLVFIVLLPFRVAVEPLYQCRPECIILCQNPKAAHQIETFSPISATPAMNMMKLAKETKMAAPASTE